jgi:PAS domain S-box-containing protein
MKNSVKRFSVVVGFLALLVVLAVNALVTRHQVASQVEAHYSVEHTQQVLLELAQIDSLLTQAESGQRGFLHTDNEQYLRSYTRATNEIESYIKRLAELTADNPVQRPRIPQLRELTQHKLAEMAETIRLHRAGDLDGARALVQSDDGLLTMQQIRAVLADMQQEEVTLETRRTQAYAQSVKRTVASVYATTALAILGLGFLAFYILREIRLREKHGEQIRQREEWFRVTLTSIGDGVIATDENGLVTFINPIAEQLAGTTLAQSRGRNVQKVLPLFNEATQKPVENPVSIVMKRGVIVGLANHTVLKRPDGTTIPIEDSAAPIRDDKNRLVGVVLVFRDASKDRNAQEILRKTEKLAAAARLAATVAHEINNPLEAVGNLLYLAKATPSMPLEATEHLQLAEQELERVSHITRQTLGFYRESGTFDTVEISELMESVLKIFDNKVRNKRIRLETHLERCEVRGRMGELRQLVSNLISNAIDAVAPGGGLKLATSCITTEDGTAVQISVEDDGPGVDPRHLEHIFEPFFTTKKDIGTGLGLWVSKQIVERHGGRIQVNSPGKDRGGAKFTVTLPLTEGEKSAIALAN